VKQAAAFVAVGAIGFCVDAGVLTAMVSTQTTGPYAGRLVSFPVAVFVTWLLNRSFVFESRAAMARTRATEYGRYFTVQVVGAAANLLVYGLALLIVPVLAEWPVVPLAAGAAVGLLINFTGSKRWAFR
jgi:putative flippase GtrA